LPQQLTGLTGLLGALDHRGSDVLLELRIADGGRLTELGRTLAASLTEALYKAAAVIATAEANALSDMTGAPRPQA
jgi:hypothetical protein